MQQTPRPLEVKILYDIPVEEMDLILLDLDNTLYEYKRCHEFALNKLTGYCATEFELSTETILSLYNDARKGVHDKHLGTATSHSRLFYIQNMSEKILGRTSPELILTLHDLYWKSYIGHIELYDEAIPFLEKCLKKKIPVIMVTDLLADIQFKKIVQLGISKYFQFVVTSDEAGVEKPHPYIFESAILKALLVNPALKKIAVIGDNIKKDVYSSNIYAVHCYHTIKE